MPDPAALALEHVTSGYGDLTVLRDVSVEVAGGENVFADSPRGAMQLSTEQVLRSQPDVIFDSSGDPAGATAWSDLAVLPAVGHGRVLTVRDPAFTVPGPRVGRAAAKIARLLHPEVFPTEAQ